MDEQFAFQCNICYLDFSQYVVPMIICHNSHFACRGCINKIKKHEEHFYRCPYCKEKTEINFPFQFKKIFAIKKISNNLKTQMKKWEEIAQDSKQKAQFYLEEIYMKQSQIQNMQICLKDKEEQYIKEIDQLCLQNQDLSKRLQQQKNRSELIFHKNFSLQNMNYQLKQQISRLCKKYQEKYLQNQMAENQISLEFKKKIQKQKEKNDEILKQNEQLYAQTRRLKAIIKNINKKDQALKNNQTAEVESINYLMNQQVKNVPNSTKSIKEKKMKIKKAKQVKIPMEEVLRRIAENIFQKEYQKDDSI